MRPTHLTWYHWPQWSHAIQVMFLVFFLILHPIGGHCSLSTCGFNKVSLFSRFLLTHFLALLFVFFFDMPHVWFVFVVQPFLVGLGILARNLSSHCFAVSFRCLTQSLTLVYCIRNICIRLMPWGKRYNEGMKTREQISRNSTS